jgi:hypothetical protein
LCSFTAAASSCADGARELTDAIARPTNGLEDDGRWDAVVFLSGCDRPCRPASDRFFEVCLAIAL